MTPEDLERLVALGDTAGLAAAVAELSEAERKKLSKTAQTLKRDIQKVRWEFDGSQTRHRPLERLDAHRGDKQVRIWEQAQAADLAVLAVGPLTQAKKVYVGHHSEDDGENLGLKVLCDRRPDWADNWVANAISGESPSIDWDMLWTLIKKGVCRKPESEDYYRAMAQLLTGWRRQKRRGAPPALLSDELVAEPELLDDVWKLFEVDTVAFAYDWNRDDAYESWSTAVVKLADRGLLDRDRLLDATLAGLTTGFKTNVLGGFAKLHEKLQPTPDEMAARQATYCDLLSVHQPQVVGFAVKMLKQLDQKKRLDDEAFVTAAGRVFDVATKGPPKAVIGLLKKLVKRRTDLVPQAVRALLDALHHPAEDVQGAAIDLLAALGDRLITDDVRQIAERLDDLPATVRPRAAALVSAAGGEVEAASVEEPAIDVAEQFAKCRWRADALEPRWREAAGADAALAACERADWPPPLEFDPLAVPVLSGLERVEPIASLEELIDAVAHAIEQVDSAIEVERILDGISRFCDQRGDDFDRRVAPLIQRMETNNTRAIGNQYAGPVELPRVIHTWLTGRDQLRPEGRRSGDSPGATAFIDLRLSELRRRIVAQGAAPLLATPTHRGGWIAPAAIVGRWQEIERGGARPSKYELIQALLRMAPEGRAAALEQAASLSDPRARALRWALGGKQGPQVDDAADASVWLAAGRARRPRGVLEELAIVGLQDAGPDAVEPARYEWKTSVDESKDPHRQVTYRIARLKVTSRPQLTKEASKHHGRPSVLLHVQTARWKLFGGGAPWVYEWVSTVWPANADGFFAIGLDCLVRRLDEGSSNWEPNHPFLPPLFEPDRPWSDVARLLVMLGAAGRDADVRGLAVDALVEAIADGRAHPAPLGHTLATLAEPYWLKLNRLCEVLAEVARVSPLHAWTILGTLEALLAAYETLPRDAHHLLALLQELHAQLGLPVPEEAAAKLRVVKGSSKTAKLAKALCRFAPRRPTPACDEARLMALQARLDRAERWAGAGSRESAQQ